LAGALSRAREHPLARGWFRQDDFPQNEVLYDDLGPKTYLDWLRGLGVEYVVLSDSPVDYSARGEATAPRPAHHSAPSSKAHT
jgi:hypothetical protein